MKRLQPILLISLSLIIAACAEGPSSQKQLAVQGLLSGDITLDGNMGVIGSIHHGGSFWNLKKKERLFDWNHKKGELSAIRASAISGNGMRAVTCVEDNMVLWNTSNGQYEKFWQAGARIESITLNTDGSRALMGLKDGTVSFFNMNSGASIHDFKHTESVRSIGLSEDGKIGISGSDDQTAKIWDLREGKEIRTIQLKNQIKTVSISPSGKYAFTTAQREDAIIWDVQKGKKLVKLQNRYTNYTASVFSHDDKYLILGTFQGEIKRINAKSGKESHHWQAKPRKAFGGASSKAIVALTEHKRKVSALTSDGMLQIFKL